MRWTREPPAEAGWYWLADVPLYTSAGRVKGRPHSPTLVLVRQSAEDGRWEAWNPDDIGSDGEREWASWQWKFLDQYAWAGPIPKPEEASCD